MAESNMPESNTVPAGPAGGPATPPRILPWLLMYTVGRLGIFAVLTLLLWWAGLDLWSGLLFGLLLSMPAAYLLLRPSRERLNDGLAARRMSRQASKNELRARLSGDDPAG